MEVGRFDLYSMIGMEERVRTPSGRFVPYRESSFIRS